MNFITRLSRGNIKFTTLEKKLKSSKIKRYELSLLYSSNNNNNAYNKILRKELKLKMSEIKKD